MVEARKRRIASSTCSSVAIGERASLARDSLMRTMASSWRIVMGMEERAFADSSAAWTWRRMETKWEESFSAASGDNLGAHFLFLG
jgi:hypothetical protein